MGVPVAEASRQQLKVLADDRESLKAALVQAQGMIKFLEDVDAKMVASQPKLDYYEQMEVDLMTKHGDRLEIMSVPAIAMETYLRHPMDYPGEVMLSINNNTL